jgi:hypothetical protein
MFLSGRGSLADTHFIFDITQVYSLPICFARVFRNCGYLEYPALGRFPAEPVNGYVASGADLGDLCCPCWFPKTDDINDVTEGQAEADMEDEKQELDA